jgi:long-chain acyl-CoA synthetase
VVATLTTVNVASGLAGEETAPAIVDATTGASVTASELRARVQSMASALRSVGVQPGDRVAILQRNSIDHVAAWYGALHAGAIAVDVNYLLSAEELGHILADARPAVVLADEGMLPEDAGPVGVPVHEPGLWQGADAGAALSPTAAGDPAVIAYTSGTTGLPKGVVHTHAAIAAQIRLLGEVCGYAPGWTSYTAIPLFALPGYLPQVAATLRFGGTVVLDGKFEARRFAAMSRQYSIQYTTLSSPMLPRLLELGENEGPDLSGLKLMSCGGAPLTPEVRAAFESRFGVHLTQGYSCTEVMGAFVMDIDGDAPNGAVGRVYPRTPGVVRIVDAEGQPLPPADTGEITFARRFALARYWDRDGVSSPFIDDEWYATGDIGRVDEAGFLYVLDRKKDVIVRGGFNIYSAEIERVLIEHPQVAEASVVGMPDERLGEVPVAYVVPAADGVDVATLRAYTDQRLGRLKRIEVLYVVGYDDLPRNGLGKVRKAELRAQLRAGTQPVASSTSQRTSRCNG